jgi:hypothetical protein
MKPITINNKKYFPQPEQLLRMLKDGDMFKTKHASEIYTIKNGEYVDNKGETRFFPSAMPVVPVKEF